MQIPTLSGSLLSANQQRAIFTDWFIDFGPVRAKAEGQPAYLASELWDLFPDALDDDDKPVGWLLRPLDEVATFLNGLPLQKYPAEGDGQPSRNKDC